jgi:uncharacterized damage-inducible protein DinB
MSPNTFAKLDIAEYWGRLNDTIVELVEYIPEDRLDWSPRADMWDFRTILTHLSGTRASWLTREVIDHEKVVEGVRSRDDLRRLLRESWAKVGSFLAEERYLDRVYEGSRDGEGYSFSGHWIAFHLLEHDIHHRSDIFHYLALLEIDHPDVGTP